MLYRASELDGYLEKPRQRETDMRFGTWNVRSLYSAGSNLAQDGDQWRGLVNTVMNLRVP
jgi:hypothetical protein